MELHCTILRIEFDMKFDIHDYDTREAGSINVYLPIVHKEIYRNIQVPDL